jgi:hypothetical protein
MLPVSLDFRFVFLHLVYLLCCQFLWIAVLFFFILCTSYVARFSGLSFLFFFILCTSYVASFKKRQTRESGNIGGTQDEEKQNGNPEKLAL